MRKYVIFLLILSLMFAATGCKRDKKLKDPTLFYYCRRQIAYNESENVFLSENREGNGLTSIQALIEDYLKGPEAADLIGLFPSSLTVTSVVSENGLLTIRFSPHLSRLSPPEITLACTGLSLTLFSYADISAVEFLANGVSFNGKESITITRDSLHFADTVPQKDPA